MANDQKHSRRKWLRIFSVTFAIGVAVLFVVYARLLIPPVAAAFILAYLFKPLVYAGRLKGISRSLTTTLILVGLFSMLFGGFKAIEQALPAGIARLEKQVEIQYQINRYASEFLKVSSDNPNEGLFVYRYFHSEIDKLMKSVNSFLNLSADEAESLQVLWKAQGNPRAESLLEMMTANTNRTFWVTDKSESLGISGQMPQFTISQLTVWILLPIIFFFLLMDDGGVLRFFVRMVPNSYFELSLTLMERVDQALGRYLRGTALECSAVGLVITVILLAFGMDTTAAITVGLIGGIFNAIPFLGTLIALVLGIILAITQQKVAPWLPFLNKDHLILGVCAAVGIAHLLDNAVFQPLLIGRAVNLHPVAVILVVAASGVAFGFIGMLLAIPTTVTLKVCFETLSAGLRDYDLI